MAGTAFRVVCFVGEGGPKEGCFKDGCAEEDFGLAE